jgi:hypothetical protein
MGRNAGVSWVGLCLAAVLVGSGAPGCTAPRPKPDIKDPDPSVSIPGIKIAADRKDLSAAPDLVKALESDDPAIRFYAIGALIKITGGERFEYEYYYDEEQRKPSIAKWQEWLKGQQGSGPPTGP